MKVHLVAGFLGSGKTTAITNACKSLMDTGFTTSIVTNDQGKYIVDSKFVQSLNIPNAEVKGGCFCCNYNQLNDQIDFLNRSVQPNIVFAESVGSCTDLVATVLKPLLKFKEQEIEQLTFSTFVDSRLLFSYLLGEKLPFDDDTNYIWSKQIEESEILVVNKVDLLEASELQQLNLLADKLYPTKNKLYQNSLDVESINTWIKTIDKQHKLQLQTIEVDYKKYGAGEANLAWLDEEIEFTSNDYSALNVVDEFINKFSNGVMLENSPIGHLKFLVSYNNRNQKISYTTLPTKSTSNIDLTEKTNRVRLIVNARIQTSPEKLRESVFNIVEELNKNKHVDIKEDAISFFRPGFPNPTHRLV